MNSFEQKTTQSRTSLSDSKGTSPSAYIEVGGRQNNIVNQYGVILVRFAWDLLSATIAPSYFIRHVQSDKVSDSISTIVNIKDLPEYQEFQSQLNYYVVQNSLYDSALGIEATLNREVNKSLQSVRTSVGVSIGSGTATLILENIDYKWLFQGTSQIFSDLYGESLFIEGLYVTIDALGRFDTNTYYRIFNGSVRSTTIVDNPLDRKITIECKDLSRFLTLSRYNIHPAIFETNPSALQQNPIVTSTALAGLSNADIARKIIPRINDAIWSNPVDKYSLAAYKEMWQDPIPSVPVQQVSFSQGDNGSISADIVLNNYKWNFSVTDATYKFDTVSSDTVTTFALIWGDRKYSPALGAFSENNLEIYEVYASMFKFSQLFTSEFKTRAEILNEVSVLTFFATYLDSSGNIHFHPPRYDYLTQDSKSPIFQLNFTRNGDFVATEDPSLYVLDPAESLSESYMSMEDNIVTSMIVSGELNFLGNIGQTVYPPSWRAYTIWIDGMKRYGYREKTLSTPAFQNMDPDYEPLKTFCLAGFLRLLLERKEMSCTIPMRPEIDVDRPFFIPDKNLLYHVKSVSHSCTFGGDRSPGEFITTLSCNAGRPVSQGALITPNIFRTTKYSDLKKILFANGYNLDINYEMVQQ